MATEVVAERVAELLARGAISPVGLLPGASNDTFLCTIAHEDLETYVVYKPRDGEAPLWDFPDGTLYRREMAAFVVDRALGWELVPPTLVRDGPYGVGAVQLYIDHDPAEHYLTLEAAHRDVFLRVAAFDVLINNADRKSGHCLLQRGTGRIFVVDHGVTFHTVPKLRTVIWDYAGERVPDDVAADVERLASALDAGGVRAALDELLPRDEIDGVRARIRGLVRHGTYPEPGPGRPYPWPPV
jgi:uncharacterized repeat protein (TIGR03843 family)